MKPIRLILLLVVFNLVSFSLSAQPGDPGGGGNPTVPITGIEFLLGGGAILGLRKIIVRIKSTRKD